MADIIIEKIYKQFPYRLVSLPTGTITPPTGTITPPTKQSSNANDPSTTFAPFCRYTIMAALVKVIRQNTHAIWMLCTLVRTPTCNKFKYQMVTNDKSASSQVKYECVILFLSFRLLLQYILIRPECLFMKSPRPGESVRTAWPGPSERPGRRAPEHTWPLGIPCRSG